MVCDLYIVKHYFIINTVEANCYGSGVAVMWLSHGILNEALQFLNDLTNKFVVDPAKAPLQLTTAINFEKEVIHEERMSLLVNKLVE